ncbi:hypothetical protein AVP43_00592 [Geobacillus stearothermophilus]|nr:hypothetical protein AVP43_00592 [Geobacillus stearothermophilus]
MMNYPEQKIIQAFQLYTKLARDGVVGQQAVQLYKADDDVRGLLDMFSREVDCVIVITSEQMFLVPRTKLSPFHVSNDWIKRNYLRSGATNGDIYLLYFGVFTIFCDFHSIPETC